IGDHVVDVDGLFIDTCYADQSSSQEAQITTNSAFDFYHNSDISLAYPGDVQLT
ncbi:hypothetical protein K431DRAFT_230027, partial [Polychaeton citri CBS 116435]